MSEPKDEEFGALYDAVLARRPDWHYLGYWEELGESAQGLSRALYDAGRASRDAEMGRLKKVVEAADLMRSNYMIHWPMLNFTGEPESVANYDQARAAIDAATEDSEQAGGSAVGDNPRPTPSACSERDGYDQQPEGWPAGNVAMPYRDADRPLPSRPPSAPNPEPSNGPIEPLKAEIAELRARLDKLERRVGEGEE